MALDTQLFYLFNNLAGQSPFFDEVVVFFASWFPYILIALFLVLVWFSVYEKRKKIEVLLVTGISSVIAGLILTPLIRFFYHHPRPFMVLPVHQLFTDASWSFPSRHATLFFAMATAVYLYNKKWGIGFFVAAMFITVSRVIAGIHYPSDIAGGALIGILIAYTTFSVARKWLGKQPH